MNRVNPFFSARMINRIKDYSRFFHTRAYLRQRSACFPSPAADLALMSACGYKKVIKFRRHRREWDVLARKIPLAYLGAIGAGLDILALTAEADMQEFRAALALPLFPEYAVERVMPGFYMDIGVPSNISEAEAISLLKARSRETQHDYCIKFPGLKATFIRANGSVSIELFEPIFRTDKGYLYVGRDGGRIGTTTLGR